MHNKKWVYMIHIVDQQNLPLPAFFVVIDVYIMLAILLYMLYTVRYLFMYYIKLHVYAIVLLHVYYFEQDFNYVICKV